MSKINKMERKERGDLDVLENYARFYLDSILPEVAPSLSNIPESALNSTWSGKECINPTKEKP